MDNNDIHDLIKIMTNQSKLIKYYSISWFLAGILIGLSGIVIVAAIFGNK